QAESFWFGEVPCEHDFNFVGRGYPAVAHMCLPGLVLTQRFKQHLEQIGFDSRFPLAHPGLVLLIAVILIGERGFKAESKYKSFFFLVHRTPQELSDIDRSTAANDPRPSASFSTRKNAQRIPANTP